MEVVSIMERIKSRTAEYQRRLNSMDAFLEYRAGQEIKKLRSRVLGDKQPYPLESRSYVVSSDNKAYRSCMGGYSIFAHNLDGSDRNAPSAVHTHKISDSGASHN